MAVRRPHAVLGIGRDADVAEIKRAYARLIKVHRPDVDAQRFQQIHEAFEACLAIARTRAQAPAPVVDLAGDDDVAWEDDGFDDDEEADDDADDVDTARAPHHAPTGFARPPFVHPPRVVPPPSGPRPDARPPARVPPWDSTPPPLVPVGEAIATPAAQERTFALRPFFAEFERIVGAEGAAGLDRWLHAHEDLYSLQLKRALVEPVVQYLTDREPPLDLDTLDVVLRFFDLDSVGQRHARLESQLDWLRLDGRARAEFDKRIAWVRKHPQSLGDGMLYAELLEPWSLWRRLVILALPGRPHRLMELANRLREMNAARADQSMRADTLAYWARFLARDTIDWRRAATALLQCASIPLVLGIAGMLVVDSPAGWLIGLSLAMPIATVWTLYAVGNVIATRWRAARDRKRAAALAAAKAAGLPPPPARDNFLVIVITAAVLTLAGAVLPSPDGAPPGAAYLFQMVAPTMLLVVGGRLRFEVVAWMAGVCLFGVRAVQKFAPPDSHAAYAGIAVVLAVATAGIIALDAWHAHRRREPLALARRSFDRAMFAIGIVAFFASSLFG